MKHVEAPIRDIHDTARALRNPILLPATATAAQQRNPITQRYQREPVQHAMKLPYTRWHKPSCYTQAERHTEDTAAAH